jgi:hypothetical protein
LQLRNRQNQQAQQQKVKQPRARSNPRTFNAKMQKLVASG